jgi:acyl transferase domain-containing protein/acyl carrier protein
MAGTPHTALTRQPIAIVGLSGRFPGARSLEHFWENLRAGLDVLQTFTDEEMASAGVPPAIRSGSRWVNRGTVLDDVDRFDASFFGYSPREAQILDPQQRIFLECAWEALEHAGYAAEPAGRSIGVYAGASINSYLFTHILSDPALAQSVGGYQLMLGNDKDFLCTRVSYKLDLHGPSLTIQTACSTSLVAVEVACRALQLGECDMALAGGVSLAFPQRTGYQYEDGMIFSPDGTCRPFDAEGRGTRAGAGAGIVVLKRLDQAIADRDTIHAVILGAAINNDGAGKAGYTAPSIDGQVDAIAQAQALAGVPARSISYIEAHGTATPLGDPIEIAALTRAFRASTPDAQFCALGSLKANLGHLDAAAGVAALIKTVLALEHRELPPLAHFRSPNPLLDLPTSPFRVPTSAEPWTTDDTPRRAGVSSFGIGGTNAHVVVEEAPAAAATTTHRAHQLFVLSARTPAALDAATANLAEALARPQASMADVAYTLQVGRRAFPHRRALVVRDVAEARDRLARPNDPAVVTGRHEGSSRPVAFMFSGQGSQHAGMCRVLYRDEPVFRDAIDRCAAHLAPVLGLSLADLLNSATDATINETQFAQPLLFATEYALATLWMTWGVEPAAMLGHSIGEYVAAHLAGVISLEDALTLVAARGRLMQALQPGDMMAVSLADDDLRRRLPGDVEVAAINAPELCTVSGPRDAIAAFAQQLTDAGISHRRLHTSHAFHSSMMAPAMAPFAELVRGITLSPPQLRYVSNVTGTWISPEDATSVDYYVAHLREAVRFADGVATLAADPSLMLLEVGPGTVLSALAKQTLGRDGGSRVVASLPHPREERGEHEALLTAAGRLWTNGVALDWAGMHRDEQLGRVPLPSYPFERTRHWVDAAVPAVAPETAAAVQRHASLAQWFHRPSWIRATAPATARVAIEGAWLVFGDETVLTASVLEQLRNAGATPQLVRRGATLSTDSDNAAVRPLHSADYAAVLGAAAAGRDGLRGVIHLWNAGAAAAADGSDRDRAIHEISALGKALLDELPLTPVRLIVATSGAQSVLGEAVSMPLRALVTGPVLVLPEEHEQLQARALDIDGSTDAPIAAAAIVAEAAIDDGESFVALRSGLRWARRFETAPLQQAGPGALPLRERGVYLLTGGLGGIAVTLAEWLATTVGARVVLTTRTTLPARESWDAQLSAAPDEAMSAHILSVRRIEAAGGEVMVVTADPTNREAMQQAVDAARERWGALHGVVHAAGMKGDALLAASTRDHAEAVLAPKVDGLDVLRAVLADATLDFVVLCSSISAAAGFPGTTAYASANAYLDAFAVSSQCPSGWRPTAIAWDSWRDVGMALKLAGPQARGRAGADDAGTAMRPSEGAETFARALAAGLPQYLVSPYDVPAGLAARRRLVTARAEAARTAASTATEPALDAADASMSAVERELLANWKELLGVDDLTLDDDFFDLGGHSLLATRVLARIDRAFGVRLPLRAVFDNSTIRRLALIVDAQRVDDVSAALAHSGVESGEREEFEL